MNDRSWGKQSGTRREGAEPTWSPHDARILAREILLAGPEEAARWSPGAFTEAARDILLSPEEWERYAAEIEESVVREMPGAIDDWTRRIAQRGLADLRAEELAHILSSSTAFRAVTTTLRLIAVEEEQEFAVAESPSTRAIAEALDARQREALLLLLDGGLIHEIAIDMRLELSEVLDSLASVRMLLERATLNTGSTRRHLDFTVDQVAQVAGSPRFWGRWSDHLESCARCRQLCRAAVELRLGLEVAAGETRGSQDDTKWLHVSCLAIWCLSAESTAETVWRWLRIGERTLREECLYAIVNALLRWQPADSAQQRILTFISRHAAYGGKPEAEWIPVIGRFQPCNALDPAAWDQRLASGLPGWFGEVLIKSLYWNRNPAWEARVQRWGPNQPWQGPGFDETYDTYIQWVANLRGE